MQFTKWYNQSSSTREKFKYPLLSYSIWMHEYQSQLENICGGLRGTPLVILLVVAWDVIFFAFTDIFLEKFVSEINSAHRDLSKNNIFRN